MTKKLPRRPGGPKSLPPRPSGKGPKRPGESGTGAKPLPPRPPGGRAARPAAPSRAARRSRGSGRSWLKTVFRLGIVVLLLAGALSGVALYWLRSSLPQVEGTTKLAGLTASVEVLRDRQGIPHLYGADLQDLARAMGYVHAQDRLFQMELSRRLGAGRLSEIFGPSTLSEDRVARRLGLAQAAQAELDRMNPEARGVLEAYAAGVNAYRAESLDSLPPEFRLLSLEPAPWEAVDSVVIGKWMAHVLSENGSTEMLRQNLAGAVGLEAAYRLTGLEPPPPPSADSSTGNAAGFARDNSPARRPHLVALDPPETSSPFRTYPGASNAWVVSSERSSTGHPLLASDPHLTLSMPSVWYPIHLEGGGLEVAGASLPGVPMVLIGRNRRIAWGITALFADVQDLYLETPNPDNPRQYLTPEGYVDLDILTETITVKDQSPVTEEVRVSRHGVIVGESGDGRLLAQKWDALWSGDHLQAAIDLDRAGSWEEFTEALRGWSSPALSFVYADVEGNIGFFPAGSIPVRLHHDGAIPVDGASGAYEWAGTIEHSLKPMIFNPESGMIVSANHPMVPPGGAYPLGADTLAPFRARRIEDLLATLPRSSLDDFSRFQSDRYDPSTESVLRYAVALRPTEEASRNAVEMLRGWNGQMTTGPAPAIYEALYLRLLENVFADELGEELFRSYLDFLEIGHPGGLYAVLDDEASPFWDDRSTPAVETRDQIFLKSLDEAVALLTRLSGSAKLEAWDWGKLHGVVFRHPLGAKEPLSWLLSRGPVPFGGSTYTVANAVVSLHEPFETTLGTSFRFVADLSSPDASRWTIPTGSSGHPLSAHYFDQNPAWLDGKSAAMPLERASIEPGAKKLVLQP